MAKAIPKKRVEQITEDQLKIILGYELDYLKRRWKIEITNTQYLFLREMVKNTYPQWLEKIDDPWNGTALYDELTKKFLLKFYGLEYDEIHHKVEIIYVNKEGEIVRENFDGILEAQKRAAQLQKEGTECDIWGVQEVTNNFEKYLRRQREESINIEQSLWLKKRK